MCAIAGIFKPNTNADVSQKTLLQMLAAMDHRGPDNKGIWQNDAGLSLGHCRLSILDLDTRSNQPMVSSDNRYLVVYNGEIYNYDEIAERLQRFGVVFRTTSDTEVLLQAFIYWGEACLEMFDGMFAFAIWDKKLRKLFLARDRFGEKPLFYVSGNGQFIFASQLSALLQCPEIPKKLNAQAVREYLELGYVLSTSSIIEGVQKLPAAHFMWVDERGCSRPHRYWDCMEIARRPKANFKSLDEASDMLAEVLRKTVSKRLIADVPVGLFLSGGIDSSLLCIAARKWLKMDGVSTFSAGFREKGYSELEEARATASLLGTTHYEVFFRQEDIVNDIEKIVLAANEPFADTSMVSTYYLSKFTKKHVTVSLSGDGGDELFAGYETYMADRIYQKISWLPKGVLSISDSVLGLMPASHQKVGAYYKLRAFVRGAKSFTPTRAHWSWRRLLSDEQIDRLAADGARFRAETYASFEQISPIIGRAQDLSHLDQMQCIDLETWLVDDILVKLDCMTMAHSLEGRVPFLSKEMVEFALMLPENFRMQGTTKKATLRHCVAHNLNRNIAYRKKAGFNSPVSIWFNGLLNSDFLGRLEEIKSQNVINIDEAHNMLYHHTTRRDDHGYRLFAIYCLAIWLGQNRAFSF